jgi:hypothetical protein
MSYNRAVLLLNVVTPAGTQTIEICVLAGTLQIEIRICE